MSSGLEASALRNGHNGLPHSLVAALESCMCCSEIQKQLLCSRQRLSSWPVQLLAPGCAEAPKASSMLWMVRGHMGTRAGYRCFKFAVVGFDDSELLQLWVLWVYDALPPSWRRLRRSDPVESEPQDPGLTPSPELLKVTPACPEC